MQIFIQQQGQQTGPFTLDQVQSGLAAGTYRPSDLAWHEGAVGWAPISSLHLLTGAPNLRPTTSSMAVVSLVLGICSFVTVGLTSIPAVICGHLSLSKIKKSRGIQSGSGMAIAGLVCGYIGFLLFGIFLISMIAGLTAPLIIRQRQKADQTEAIHHARSFGIALLEFKSEYGRFPDDLTAAEVAKATETEIITGNSSNARFRQLFRAEILFTETPFYAKSSSTHKPDNLIAGNDCLAKGECGFAYVIHSATPEPARRPLAMAPMISGELRFEHQPFDGKAVILWTDNSVTSLPIDRASGGAIFEGENLLDPSHPVWAGQAPEIALPE